MRGELEADTLLTIVLALTALWLALEILGEVLGILGAVFGVFPFTNILGLVIVVLIVLWLLDYL